MILERFVCRDCGNNETCFLDIEVNVEDISVETAPALCPWGFEEPNWEKT